MAFNILFCICWLQLSWLTVAAFNIGGPVNTTTGIIRGKPSPLRSSVSMYLGIKYAKAPKGALRFAAPVPVHRSPGVSNTTSFPSDCPCNRVPANKAHMLGPVGEKIAKSLSQENHFLDEDCLALNIWTKPQQGERKKAVIFYIHGGAFWLGSGSITATDGSVLADENDVVVVSFNYRLSIFGFSGAPGQPWNVGLMDQRLALEWTKANIAGFGGDPSRITVIGQSVGGISADMLAFSYPRDPIAHAFIAMSGVASSYFSAAMQGKYPQKTWYQVSADLGCGGREAGEATVSCMRSKSQDALLNAIKPLGIQSPIVPFWPVPDGNLVPKNYETDGNAGRFARVPFLAGSAEWEMGLFFVIPLMYMNLTEDQVAALPVGLIRPLDDLITLIAFTCPTAESIGFRRKYQLPVWRYRNYGGDYNNTKLGPAGSCWHASDVFVLFGTASFVTGVEDSEFEAKAAAYMRDAWTTFAKDPYNGLNTRLHWPQYDPLTKSMIQLSYKQQTEASYTFNWKVDAFCPVIAVFKDIYLVILRILSFLIKSQNAPGLMDNLTDILYHSLSNEEALKTALESLQSIAHSL
ncbi:cholinesterase [Aspergillus alliaceus]|uniref:cholinesterase n=1 Tax=Petromyces alliaceus TaxID=209559 RepID=UPI0012A4C681|nr:cholinesterase [Aspergillus alliaceus]KAB8231411.1 cholinesterase [Aspergillus alliaceus]